LTTNVRTYVLTLWTSLTSIIDSFQKTKGNWMREFKKWCPSIRTIRMGGTKDERIIFEKEHLPVDKTTGKHKWDVLVTSYEGALKEKTKLGKINWKYLIIDEAHRIKNENSSLSKAVRTINTGHRLLITGTPLQVRKPKYQAMFTNKRKIL
jgi:SWI/SNF-related matrix-associated actin-dependent regulator of chromatin subfamily A member 5